MLTVDLGELLSIVPPLHHVFVVACTEGEGRSRSTSELGLGVRVALLALDVELVRAGVDGRRSAESALGQEER